MRSKRYFAENLSTPGTGLRGCPPISESEMTREQMAGDLKSREAFVLVKSHF